MYEREYGSNYKDGMSTTDIAKQIRTWIKEQKKNGTFPKELKVSARSQYFSGGSAIRISITALPDTWDIFNREYFEMEVRGHKAMLRRGVSRYTQQVEDIRSSIMAYVNSFNYDGSEIQVDYFDVNFYCHSVELEWTKFREIENAYRMMVESEVNAETA